MRPFSAGQSRSFHLRQNQLTGESEWIIVEEEDDDGEEALTESRSLLATTSYMDMLNDCRRNRAFRLAIEKAITDPCHVLDIGSGTGLLSMMAARRMREIEPGGKARVSACESFLPMGKLMRRILRANGMERAVNLYLKRSDELQVGVDLDCPASVLVSEILDSELLGEGLIPTLQHAHDMLLTTNAKTVPYRATTYGQLVESTFLWKLHDLHDNEARELNDVFLCPAGLKKMVYVKPQNYAIHFNSLCNEIRLLSEPFKIFEFDFWKRPNSHGETELLIQPTVDGTVHAIMTWWVLEFDFEGSILYSTAPNLTGSSNTQDVDCWCDHWRQCVWFIPGEGVSLSRDTSILFKAVHNVTNISYFLGGGKKSSINSINFNECHLFLSPERIGIYGEKTIRSAFLTAVKNSVLGKRVSSLPLDDNKRKIDLFMAEPFYYGNEVMLPWKNMRFWKERTILDPILSKNVIILPTRGILKACAMYLPDLWRSRRCLEDIEGFDHSIANKILGACGGNLPCSVEGPCLPYFVWQCGKIKELSDVYSIMDFNFLEPIHECHGKIKMEFSESGICHGLVLWIDWVLDEASSIAISTGPVNRFWKQGVKLLSKPVQVRAGSFVEIEASFDPSNAELSLESLFPL